MLVEEAAKWRCRGLCLGTGLSLLLFGAAAEARAQTPTQGTGERGYFGAPVAKYATLRGQGAVMLGGRGGFNLTPALVLGGGLYGTVSEVDAREGAVPLGAPEFEGLLDVKFESFGLDLEYALAPVSATHLTLGVFVGGAAARYVRDKTNEQQGETDFMFLVDPSVGLERGITDWLHLHIAASYRLVTGVEQPGLGEDDLRGAAVALAAKIGRFP